ncbi:hypothetical protein [Rhizobium mesoamericanum]|uniref:hypothetical protein n=1 Tax=Rhizobium mesoamericanum TaxID=1079800 RepID=UPI00041C67D1|nr:hypothetical protein [Rhizobium mesoamericanum]
MKERELKELGEALLHEIRSDITPKKLVRAVQKSHPDATKKEIVRAAFYALIAKADKSHKAAKPKKVAKTEQASSELH